MKKSPSLQQMGFSIEEGRFFIPQSLTEQPYGKKLIEILQKNSLFKERSKKGYTLLIDLTYEQGPKLTIYNTNNWQQENQKPENLINQNYSAAIIVANSIISPDEFQQLLEENKKRLNLDGGQLFIYETGLSLSQEDLAILRQEREEILKKLGLIKIKTLSYPHQRKNQPISEILTQARLKKIAEYHPHEVNLLLPRKDDPYWKAKWRRNLIPNIIKMYQQAGFVEIDVFEIEERLKHSKNPPEDLAKARDGFGVRAKAPCGCYIEVSLNGSTIFLKRCQDHPNGIDIITPSKKDKEVFNIGEKELKTVCFDCGAKFIQSVRVIKSYPNGKTSLQIEIRCPHCGLISTERKYVSSKLVI